MSHADALDLFEAREAPVGSVSLSQALREMLPFEVPELLPVGRPSQPPEGPVLALAADVRHVGIDDLLGLLHRAERSGLLLFGYRDHAKSVYVHDGEVVFAASNLAGDRIGESLVRSGTLSLEALRLAERSFAPGQRFGKVLVELGHVTPRELWHGVKYQVEEIVRSLFSYTDGAVYFFAGEVKPDNVVRLSLPTERLVVEGMEHREVLCRFVAELQEPEVELVRVKGGGDNLEGLELLLYQTLETVQHFDTLLANVDVEPWAAARAIQMLRGVGALQVERHEPEPPAPTDEEELLRSSLDAHIKLMAELAAPIVALEGAEPLRERFGPVVEEVSHRYPALLTGVPLLPTVTLDPAPLLLRALSLTGDRIDQLRVGLGELVSYLEFELKNHPDVDDATPFLLAVDLLRAEL